MFESIKEEIISIERFSVRLVKYFFIATALLIVGLVPGAIGFQLVSDLNFSQSLINSISLLGTVEPPYELSSTEGVVFTAVYGLFVETVFFLSIATLLAPVVHRGFHRLHIETEKE